MNEEPRPTTIFFFSNGTTAVCDQDGQQMPKYQQGWHGDSIAALKADGIDWRAIPKQYGELLNHKPRWMIDAENSRFTGTSPDDTAKVAALLAAGYTLGRILELVQAVRDGDAEPARLDELARIWEGVQP